jgi:hypothetical protein
MTTKSVRIPRRPRKSAAQTPLSKTKKRPAIRLFLRSGVVRTLA